MSKILEKYKLKFVIQKIDITTNRAEVIGEPGSKEDFYIPFIFLHTSPEYYREEVLPEIDKAIQGLPFVPDWDGVYDITIQGVNSIIEGYGGSSDQYTIPTKDLKEIIELWCDWIENLDIDFVV